MALWFGIVAKRSGRNVLVWAIGGAVLAFVVGLIVGVVAREVVGRVRLRDYSTYLIVTALISIGLTIAIGALITRALGGARDSTLPDSKAGSVVMDQGKILPASGPIRLLEQVKRPQAFVRAVPASVLWSFPLCYALLFVLERLYVAVLRDSRPFQFAGPDLCWVAATILTGLSMAIILRQLRHVVAITLSFAATVAILHGGAVWCFYAESSYSLQETLQSMVLPQALNSAVWAALFLGTTLGLSRGFGVRWWVLLSSGCLAALPTWFLAWWLSESFHLDPWVALASIGQGGLTGLVLFLAFYLAARLGIDWARQSGEDPV